MLLLGVSTAAAPPPPPRSIPHSPLLLGGVVDLYVIVVAERDVRHTPAHAGPAAARGVVPLHVIEPPERVVAVPAPGGLRKTGRF